MAFLRLGLSELGLGHLESSLSLYVLFLGNGLFAPELLGPLKGIAGRFHLDGELFDLLLQARQLLFQGLPRIRQILRGQVAPGL
jgi:hypothetical protein